MLGNDTRRRITEVERRIDWLDQNGTRGFEAMRAQLAEQAKDLETIDRRIGDVHNLLDDMRAGRMRTFAAYALAIMPIYVLLFLSVTSGTGR